MKYFPNKLFEDFATETNLYYMRETGNALNTNTAEIRKIFDMNILMGNMKLPRIRKYWQPATRIDRAADVKPVNRFFYFEKTFILCLQKILLKTILISFGKVAPAIQAVRNVCINLSREEFCSADEQMIPFTGWMPAR